MRLLLSAGKNIQYKLLSFRVNISRRNEYFSNERMNDVGTYCHTRKQVIIYWPMEYTYSIFIIFSKLLLICFTLSFFDVNFRIVMPKKTNESAKNNLKELAVFFSLLLRVCVFFLLPIVFWRLNERAVLTRTCIHHEANFYERVFNV